MRFELHIPAWHHAEEGDKSSRVIRMRMDQLPQEGNQIEVPNKGLVEVVKIRFRPLWTDDPEDSITRAYGPDYAYSEIEPQVFTNWVTRPEGAKRPTMRIL